MLYDVVGLVCGGLGLRHGKRQSKGFWIEILTKIGFDNIDLMCHPGKIGLSEYNWRSDESCTAPVSLNMRRYASDLLCTLPSDFAA